MNPEEKFNSLFSMLTLRHKNIELNRVLCSRLMYYSDGRTRILGKGISSLARFLLQCDVSQLSKEPLKGILIVFGQYHTRKDHKQLMQGIASKFEGNATYIDTTGWNTRKIRLSFPNIFQSLKYGVWGMRKADIGFLGRLRLAATICYYLNTIDAVSGIDFSSVEKFLCLANSLDLENLLTQHLKLKGVKTYSMMEGVYIIQDSSLSITNIPFVNLTSDIQLCWGQYSKEEFIKYGFPDKRMIVAGYPKTVNGRPMKDSNPFKKGVVLLSQYIMEPHNTALIELLSEFSSGQEFYLKLHPSLDYASYSVLADKYGMKIISKQMTVDECIDNEKFDFAIAINSTAYYEALMRGVPTFRFSDGSFTALAGCNDEFNSAETYSGQLDRIKNIPIAEYQKEVDVALRYAVGWGIDRYKEILEE